MLTYPAVIPFPTSSPFVRVYHCLQLLKLVHGGPIGSVYDVPLGEGHPGCQGLVGGGGDHVGVGCGLHLAVGDVLDRLRP